MSAPAPATPEKKVEVTVPESFAQMPLVLGIAGSKMLGKLNPQQLKEGLRDYLGYLRTSYPDTPFLFLTSLTGEVAQFLAQEALAYARKQEKGMPPIELIVVLSLPLDLLPEPMQATFRPFLEGNRYVEVAEIPSDQLQKLESALSSREGGPSLGEALEYLADRFMARNAQILIAAWEGKAPRAVKFHTAPEDPIPGPVSAVIEELPALLSQTDDPLESPETGIVCQLASPDQPDLPSDPAPSPQAAGSPGWQERLLRLLSQFKFWERKPVQVKGRYWQLRAPQLYEEEHEPGKTNEERKYFERLHQITQDRLDRFNWDANAILRRPKALEKWQQERGRLPSSLATEEYPDNVRLLGDVYVTADQLAIHHQTNLQWSLTWAARLVLVAVVIFGFYAHLIGHHVNWFFLAAYLASLALAYIFYLIWTRWNDLQNLYQDYRTMAEGLRVQYFWRLITIRAFASDSYLSKQKNELEWIRHGVKAQALRAYSRISSSGTRAAGPGRSGVEGVLNSWLLGQLDYYRSSSLRDRADMLFHREVARGFVEASLIISFIVAIVHFSVHNHHLSFFPFALLIAFAILVAFAGTWHILTKRKESREEREQAVEELRQAEALAARVSGLEELKEEDRRDFPRVMHRSWVRGFGGGLLTACLLVGGAWLVSSLHTPPPAETPPPRSEEKLFFKLDWNEWVIVAMGLTVAWAALYQWRLEMMAFGEQHKQFRRMLTVFARAHKLVCGQLGTNDLDQARETLRLLGKEALSEHADWLMLHRGRPVELPRLEI